MQQPVANIDPLLVELAPQGNLNKWKNIAIDTTSIRAPSESSPHIPGLPTPKDGEYYTSKALDTLIKQHPDEDIGARFGNVNLGLIPDKYTASPDELSVIRGMTEVEAAGTVTGQIYEIRDNTGTAKFDGLVGFILVVGGIVLLFPIVMFLVISTQLGSAQRERRYAAIRLVGATQAQITRIMALESFVATLAGIAVGTLIYGLVRMSMTQFYYEGERFWPADIIVHPMQYVAFIVLTLALSLGATWWAMRRSRTSPLGVSRDQKVHARPRLWRLTPLIAGLAIYGFIATPFGRSWYAEAVAQSSLPLLALVLGVVLIMIGLILAGSWLTAMVARFFARRTRHAQMLIATKRIAGNSPQVFRSVSGVVLALFAGSFYLTAVSGIDDFDAQAINNNGYSIIESNNALAMGSPLPDDFEKQLTEAPYVISSAAIYQVEDGHLIRCDDLEQYTRLSCPDDAKNTEYAAVNFEQQANQMPTVVEQLARNAPKDFLVRLHSNDAIDQLRTLVATHLQDGQLPGYVVSGTYAKIAISDPLIKELVGLAYLGMAVTLLVAIASLIVSTIGGLLERKRSLIMLRLGGMTTRQMKHMVMIESLIPLITVSLTAAAIGVWVGIVFVSIVSASVSTSLSWMYFVIVAGSLLLAALAIYVILPVLSNVTSYENNRTE